MKHQSHATLTALLFLSLLLVTESPRYLQDKSTSTLQQQIATQVLRFHIRANSDIVADKKKKKAGGAQRSGESGARGDGAARASGRRGA